MDLTRQIRRSLVAFIATVVVLAATGGAALAAQSEERPTTEELTAATAGATTVLGVDLGELLELRLLGEDGLAGLDQVDGVAEALTRLVALDIASATIPALGDLSTPAVEAHSTGGEDRVDTETVVLGDMLPAELASLLGGTLDPASLLAVVDDEGARGLLAAATSNLSVLAGLLGIGGVDIDLSSVAASDAATANRGVTIDQVTALDLTGLLQLLGLDLLDLSLDQLIGLAGGLGVLDDVLGLLGLSAEELTALLDELLGLGDIGSVIDGLGIAIGDLTQVLDLCDGALAVLPICDESLPEFDDLTAALDEILALVDDLLGLVDGLLDGLDGAPLLGFDGLSAGVVASAAPTVEDSVAEVVTALGDVSVAGLTLPGLDVAATVAQVDALVGEVVGALDGVLGIVGLDGIIDIGLFETTTQVGEDDGVITALAELTGLRITITPPDLCALLGGIDVDDTVGGLLDGLGAALPELDLPVGDLLGELGSVIACNGAQMITAGLVDGTANALTRPLTIQAANVSEVSTYTVATAAAPPAVPAPAPEQPALPRTGGETPVLALVAALVAAALVVRFAVRRQT